MDNIEALSLEKRWRVDIRYHLILRAVSEIAALLFPEMSITSTLLCFLPSSIYGSVLKSNIQFQ